MKKTIFFILMLFVALDIHAQQKSKCVLKLYPISLLNNARIGIEIPLKKRFGLTATTSYYYEKPNKGGGRSNGFMGQLFINYRIVNTPSPMHFYVGGGYCNLNTGYSYKYERWDYDKANGRELSYVPFSTIFGGSFTATQISKINNLYGEVGFMGRIPGYSSKHISIGWQIGYRLNPVSASIKNIYFENHDEFDYKWYKIHFAFSQSLNTYYNSFGVGTGIKANVSVNYLF